ncbi:MAG: hypothetical protein JNK14_00200 [Chitinophagaceae bacterium]|nr:hypothetical protein [Chitinophagaceae bacterium]
MKTKFYLSAVVFFIIAFLVMTADSFAQPGRYRRGNGYNRHHSVRYYPSRNYYYNRPFVSIRFGGVHYRYQRGYFYRPYGASFRFVIPPVGIRITTLPLGYRGFYVGPVPYYYYQGTYYRPYESNQYEVVAPPLGAVVDELPPGAKATVIDGQKYYELNGTYYREEINADNELEYTVVGTDGVLNTDNSISEAETPAKVEPVVGDRFDALPVDSKAVVIKGEKLYLSPGGLYYKEVVEGGKVYYEVVGK